MWFNAHARRDGRPEEHQFCTEVPGFKLGDTSERAVAICWAHKCHGETELMLVEVANPKAGREGLRHFILI